MSSGRCTRPAGGDVRLLRVVHVTAAARHACRRRRRFRPRRRAARRRPPGPGSSACRRRRRGPGGENNGPVLRHLGPGPIARPLTSPGGICSVGEAGDRCSGRPIGTIADKPRRPRTRQAAWPDRDAARPPGTAAAPTGPATGPRATQPAGRAPGGRGGRWRTERVSLERRAPAAAQGRHIRGDGTSRCPLALLAVPPGRRRGAANESSIARAATVSTPSCPLHPAHQVHGAADDA